MAKKNRKVTKASGNSKKLSIKRLPEVKPLSRAYQPPDPC